MKKVVMVIQVVMVSVLLTACTSKKAIKKGEADAKTPINCATAEADIRVLQSEKVHVSKEIADGVTAIVPISLVLDLAEGTEGQHLKVTTGQYNKMLDAKIAEIKKECNLK
jgi:hypothetical protein